MGFWPGLCLVGACRQDQTETLRADVGVHLGARIPWLCLNLAMADRARGPNRHGLNGTPAGVREEKHAAGEGVYTDRRE